MLTYNIMNIHALITQLESYNYKTKLPLYLVPLLNPISTLPTTNPNLTYILPIHVFTTFLYIHEHYMVVFFFIDLRLLKYGFYICSLLSSLNMPRFIYADSGSSSLLLLSFGMCFIMWYIEFLLVILVVSNCFLIQHDVGNVLVYVYLGKMEDFLQSSGSWTYISFL